MSLEEKAPDVAYEHRDIRWVAVVVAGLAVFLGIHVIAWALWPFFEYLKPADPLPKSRAKVAETFADIRQPLLQPSPRADLQELQRYEEFILKGGKGNVLPVDRAIDMVVEHGLPPLGRDEGLKLWQPRAGSRNTGFDRELNRRGQQ